ncbi:minichromosome maintenance protein MCM [Candidatus Woesearchaeota archaeon]|nr:minichromosome maintenance protein MCM [Candidatus Woesearchaeota archaeon]
MELSQQIQGFQDFFQDEYYDELLERARQGLHFLIISFPKLARFNPDLANILLEQPEDVLKAAEMSLKSFDLPLEDPEFYIRFKDLPGSQEKDIRDIRAKHLGKFLQMEGIVRQKSDVRPQVTSARFECPSCGNIIPVLQLDQKFKEPTRCGCGRKGKFHLMSKNLVDAQKIVLEESPEDLEGGEQPKRLNVFLKNDLVSPMTEKLTNPGARVRVTGLMKEVPIILNQGGQSVRFDLMLDANFIEPVEEDYTQININPEEEKKIIELSKDPAVFAKLTASLAPSIYGMEKIKEALLLQLLGGVTKMRGKGGVRTRGDIHVLLIGDPGAGKSQLLKRIDFIAPKSRFVSGKGASGAGLTASVVKDEFLRGWALEAGALVLANRGICCIDELDKMTPEDRSAMHEALEQQTVTISKANIQATLRSETTVLAAANPKFGRFDPYELLAKQIDLPSTLINRFDLIFPVRDLPDREKDEQLASFILKLHQRGAPVEGEIDPKFFRKYLSYAKQRIHPRITEEALEAIKEYYIKMRGSGGGNEETIKAIPISARQLEALVRLAEASARVRLSNEATKKDAKVAIDLVHHCLSAIGLDPETGKFDIDRIATGVTATQRSKIGTIKEILAELEEAVGKVIPIEDVVREAEIKGLSADETEETLEGLKRKGDVYNPKHGFVSRM